MKLTSQLLVIQFDSIMSLNELNIENITLDILLLNCIYISDKLNFNLATEADFCCLKNTSNFKIDQK